jgi:hypothetical protein
MILSILVVLLVVYVYYIQFHRRQYPKRHLDDLLEAHTFKTGDVILMKAYNHFSAVVIGNYFTHLGLVYVRPDGTPMLFEAAETSKSNLKDHHSRAGVYLTPLKERLQKYKGMCWLKALNKPLEPGVVSNLERFISYALKHMYYSTSVVSDGLKKMVGLSRCGDNTNCAEIVFLSLLVCKLLPIDEYDHARSHIKFLSYLTELEHGYQFEELIEIVDYPFAY